MGRKIVIHNICPYVISKGPRAGQECGLEMINDQHKYCCTHRKAINYKLNVVQRARERVEKLSHKVEEVEAKYELNDGAM